MGGMAATKARDGQGRAPKKTGVGMQDEQRWQRRRLAWRMTGLVGRVTTAEGRRFIAGSTVCVDRYARTRATVVT